MRNCLLLAAAVMVCVACGSFQSGGGSVAPPPPAGGQGDTGSPSGGSGSDAGSVGTPDAGSGTGGGGSPDGGSSGSDGGTGSGGSGGGGNSPDAGSGGGTAISAEQLTSGEKAQVLALDDQNVYWASYENASKWQVTWGGSDIARSDVNGGMAYFAQSAYSSFDGCIVRANPNGAGATCIDRGKHSYIDVKVDDTHVYFIRDGDVWRLPRQ